MLTLSAVLAAVMAAAAAADQWNSLGLQACVEPARGGPTTLYSSPRQIVQTPLGTVQPGEIYRIAGVSARYRLLRATSHSGSHRPGQVVGWVWSIRLRAAPAGACN
jgi:hypothetical protein